MGSYNWNGTTGDWSVAADWGGTVPNSTTADATITAGGSYTVTIAAGESFTADSVTFGSSGGILDIAGTLGLGGTLALLNVYSGTLELAGLISGGTVDIGSTLIDHGGTIDSVFTAASNAHVELNSLTLTLGVSGLVTSYVDGPGTLDIAGTFNVGGLYLGTGATELITGLAVQNSYALLSYQGGTTASTLSIAAGGIYDITVDQSALGNSGNATILNAGLFEKTAGTNYVNIYPDFNNASTGTIFIAGSASNDISLLGAHNDLFGTITGGGYIYLAGTTTLEAALVLDPAVVTDAGDLVLESNRTIGGTFSALSNATISLNGNELPLTGTGSIDSYVDGPGTLDIAGTFNVGGLYLGTGATELITGVAVQNNYALMSYQSGTTASTLSIAAGGIYDITADQALNNYGNATILNAGLFEKTGQSSYTNLFSNFTNASTGTVYVAGFNDISFLGATADLAGTVGGPGDIYFGNSDTITLEGSLVLDPGILTLGYSDTTILEGNRTIGGSFSALSGSVLDLNGHNFTLSGSSSLTGYVEGPGTLDITGSADINGLIAVGTMTIIDQGTITQDGYNELGNTGSANVTLSIATGATYAIVNDSVINPQGTSAIDNAGLFEKNGGSGVSQVYGRLNNAATGTIEVATGTLAMSGGGSLDGILAGPGLLDLNGGTFSLGGTAALSVASFDIGGSELILENSRAYAGQFEIFGNGTLNLNSFNLSLSNAGDYLANGYLTGPGTLSEAGRSDISNFNMGGGAVLADSGTITQDGQFVMGTTASDTARLSIATTGTYNILNDNSIYANGTAGIDNAGLFEKSSADGQSNIYAAFTNASTGTLDVAHGTLFIGGGGDLAGTITGAGEFGIFNANTVSLAAAAVLNVATVFLDGGELLLLGNRSYSGDFIQNGGSTLNLGGNTLTLSGSASLGVYYLTGPGTLDITGTADIANYNLTGSAVLNDAGTITEDGQLVIGTSSSDTASLTIAAGGTYDVVNDSSIYTNGTAAIFNAGLFEKTADNGQSNVYAAFTNASTGIIDVAHGSLFLGGGGDLAGTITGAGLFGIINTDTFSLAATAVVNVATFFVDGGVLALGGNRSFAGAFLANNGGSTLDLNGFTLTLSGNDFLGSNYLSGPGTVAITGTADINGENLTNGAVLNDTGTITQDGYFRIGTSSSDTASLIITAGATYDVLNDSYIYASGTAAIDNAGLFEKSGATGQSDIVPAFTNAATGTILVASGTLAETALVNDGLVSIAAAEDIISNAVGADAGHAGIFDIGAYGSLAVQAGMAASQSISFTGTNGMLYLADAGSFAATIAGFAAGDTIDLQSRPVNLFSYANNELTLTENGSFVTSLALAGLTNSASISLLADNNGGGTLIEIGNPGTTTNPNGPIVADTWTAGSGDFNTAGNWSNGLPGSLSTAFFPTALGAITVSETAGIAAFYNFNGLDALATYDFSGGTFDALNGGSLNGTLNQTGGTIIDQSGIFQLAAGGTLAGTLAGSAIFVGTPSFVTTLATSAILSVATFGVDNGATLALEGNHTYAGSFDSGSYDTIELGGNTLTLDGPALLNFAGTIAGPGTVVAAGPINVFDVAVAGGAVLDITGVATQTDPLILGIGSTDTSTLSIAAGATYDVLTDTAINAQGTAVIANAGLFEKTGDFAPSYIYAGFTQASTGTLDATRGTLYFANTNDSFAGALDGAGEILFAGVNATFGAGLALNVATLALTSSNLSLSSNLSYAGTLIEAGSGTLELGTNTLTLSGPDTLAQYLAGAGTLLVTGTADINGLDIQGGAALFDAGTIIQDGAFQMGNSATDVSSFTIGAAGVYDLINDSAIGAAGTAAILNSGLFEKTADNGNSNISASFTNAATGTLDAATGTLSLYGGGSLAGLIEGAGELILNGGVVTIAAGATIDVATLDVNTSLVLGGALDYAGSFVATNNNIDLAGNNLTLTGSDYISSSFQGAGTVTIYGSAVYAGGDVYGGATLVDQGVIDVQSGFSVGNAPSDSAAVTIAAGSTLDFITDSAINANGTVSIVNAGLFEKNTDYGQSYIEPDFINTSTGTIDAVRGTIALAGGGSLAGTLEGGGEIAAQGGTITLDPTAVISVATLGLISADLLLGANLTYAGDFQGTASNGTLNLESHTLDLTGTANLGGFYLIGPGTLAVSAPASLNGLDVTASATLLDLSTITDYGGFQLGNTANDSASLTIATGAVFDLITDNYIGANGTAVVANAGLFEKSADFGFAGIAASFTNASTGTIEIVRGTLGLQNSGLLGGTITGGGELALASSGGLVLAPTTIDIATLAITSGGATLGTGLTYAGDFILGYSDFLSLTSYGLDLTGTASLVGGFDGPGTVTVAGDAIATLLALSGGATLLDTGSITQTDVLKMGFNGGSDSATLSIALGGIYDIADDSTIANYGTQEIVINAGLLEKTDAVGLSEVQPNFSNSGTVLVTSGTLQFDNIAGFAGGTLTGGTWEAALGFLNPELSLAGSTAISVDAASITLSGAGSEFVAGSVAIEQSLTSVAPTGVLAVLAGRNYLGAPALTDSGTIHLGGGTFAAAAITIATGGLLSGFGTVAAPIVDNGEIVVTDPTLTIAGPITGTGGLLISPSSEIILGSSAGSGTSITFGGSLAVLGLDAPASVQSTLVSLSPSDTIDLIGTLASGAAITGNTLTVSLSAGGTIAYTLATPNPLDRAVAVSDGNGGTAITIFRDAQASALTPSTIAFGEHHVGDTVTQGLTIANTVTIDAYSENLDATMAAGPGIIAAGSFTGLAPGATNSTSLSAGLNTGTAGVDIGTATANLYTDGSSVAHDGAGPLAIGAATVSLSGTLFNYATAAAVLPNPTGFGQHHVGDSVSQFLTLTNTAPSGIYSEKLDATFTGTTGSITATGSVTTLTAGLANSTSLDLVLNSSTAGAVAASATLALTSDGTGIDTLGTTALANQTIDASATLFNFATASSVAPNPLAFADHHVGNSVSQLLTLTNIAATGSFSENLDAGFTGTTGSITASGSITTLAAGVANSTSLDIVLNTGTAGAFTGAATLGLTSDGTGIDSLGTTALASQTITVSGNVYNLASASSVAPNPVGFGDHHVGDTVSQRLTLANTAAGGIYSENLDAAFSGTTGAITGSGTIATLAAGSVNTTGLDLALNSGTAGIVAGTATLALASDGTNIDSLGTTGLASQTIAATGTLFNLATASIVPNPTRFADHHVGDTVSQLLTLTNIAATGSFSENLDAGFTGTTGSITASGSITTLAAGSANSTSLDIVLNTGTAGAFTGAATLGLKSDGTGIDSLGTTALASQTITVSGNVYNLASASSVAPNPVGFGEHHVGDSISQFLTLANTAASGIYSEKLDAAFSGTTGAITASGTIATLAAGSVSSTALDLVLNTGTAGTVAGTATLALASDGTGIDSLGTTALASQTIAATGTLFNLATASSVTPNPVGFGEHHVGDSLTQILTLANVAASGTFSENLDAAFSATSGAITAAGSIVTLAAGATNATSLAITLHSATAGSVAADATLALTSDHTGIDTLSNTALTSQTVAVTGTLYNLATASGPAPSPVSFGIVHVGQVVSDAVTLANLASAGSFSENLDAAFSGTTGSIAAGGSIALLVAGHTNSTSLAISLDTGTAGTITAAATLALTSDHTGIDTLSNTGLTSQIVGVTGTVNNYATAAFETLSGPGSLSGSGSDYVLNLGSITQGASSVSEGLGVINSATGPADLLLGSFAITGSSPFTNSGFTSFSSIAAGSADTAPSISISAVTRGSFSETIVLDATGFNSSGYSGALGAETLLVTGDVVCFLEGTRIATPEREIPVEALRPGDPVLTADGETLPILWIGQRRIDCAAHPHPDRVRPVRIRRGAIAPAIPARDLLVSPDHAIMIDELLIPARLLINHASIVQETSIRRLTYYHVELARHDIIFAEGLTAETYLDTGNRTLFANAGLPPILHPDFSADERSGITGACAPLTTAECDVLPIWKRLAARGRAMFGSAMARQTTDDPDLHLIAAQRRIDPYEVHAGLYRFRLPQPSAAIGLASRHTTPAASHPWLDDRRQLGVAVTAITAGRGADARPIDLAAAALTNGWWTPEATQRWTDGNATIALAAAVSDLTVRIEPGLRYPNAAPDTAGVIRARR